MKTVDSSLSPRDRADHWVMEKRLAEAVYLSTIRFCDERIFEAVKEVCALEKDMGER